MAESSTPRRARPFDPVIFGVSATLTILFVLWSALFPENMETVINAVFSWTTEKWGWLYLWTVFLLVGASIVLLVTKFGSMKLASRMTSQSFRASPGLPCSLGQPLPPASPSGASPWALLLPCWPQPAA